jgi:hypothetical protein
MLKEIEQLRDDNKKLTRKLMEKGDSTRPGGINDAQLIQEIKIKDQENDMLRQMVEDLKDKLQNA